MRALLLIATLLALPGCYKRVGVVETEAFEETSRCGGHYWVVTHCEVEVGPWPLYRTDYGYCITHPYPTREAAGHGPTVILEGQLPP